MGGGGRSLSSSSSGEEDGDDAWRAAIDSVTSAATLTNHNSNGRAKNENDDDEEGTRKPQNIKHYQLKAQKLLDEILGKSIEVVADTANGLDKDPSRNDGGVRLFKNAPPGIVFDQLDELHGPKKKPKILPGEQLDEKSKKFRKQLQSVAVDGADIVATAKAARQKSLAKLEARETAAKAAVEKEEERLAELKKIRGERWLPSIAREMRVNNLHRR